MKRMTFKEELTILINKYGLDADTNTRDFILVNIACDALASYAGAVGAREEYQNIVPKKTIEVREAAPGIPKEVLQIVDAITNAVGGNCKVQIVGVKAPQSEVKLKRKRKRKRNKSKNNG